MDNIKAAAHLLSAAVLGSRAICVKLHPLLPGRQAHCAMGNRPCQRCSAFLYTERRKLASQQEVWLDAGISPWKLVAMRAISSYHAEDGQSSLQLWLCGWNLAQKNLTAFDSKNMVSQGNCHAEEGSADWQQAATQRAEGC